MHVIDWRAVCSRPGTSAEKIDTAEDRNKFSRLCDEAGIDFIPMIVEASGGGWGVDSRRVWQANGDSRATHLGRYRGLLAPASLLPLFVLLLRN